MQSTKSPPPSAPLLGHSLSVNLQSSSEAPPEPVAHDHAAPPTLARFSAPALSSGPLLAPPPPRRPRFLPLGSPYLLTPRPAFSPFRGPPRQHHQPGGNNNPEAVDSVRQGADLTENENINDASSVRAPGIMGQELFAAGGADMSTYRWSMATGGGGDGTILQGDRFSVWVGHNLGHIGNNTVSGDVTFATDTITFGAYNDNINGWSSGGYLAVHPHFFNPGISQSYEFASGLSLGGSKGFRVRAESNVGVLTRMSGQTLVRQQHRLVRGPQLGLGVGLWYGGVAARLGFVWDNTTVVQSWVPTARAAQILDARDAIGATLRESCEAMGLRAPLVPLPHLDAENKNGLAVGEEMLMTSAHLLTGGFAGACVGILAGGYRAHHTQSVLAVRRLDADIYRVVVTHRAATSDTLGIDIPVIADLHATRMQAQALSEAFEFDMRQPEAWEAYLKLLRHGHVPQGESTLSGKHVDLQHVKQVIHDETLPNGVSRTLLHWVLMPCAVGRGGGIASPWYLPFCNMVGLNLEYRYGDEEHVQVTRDGLTHLRRTDVTQRQELLMAGLTTQTTYVVTETHQPFAESHRPPRERGSIGVHWEFTQLGGKSGQRLVEQLNSTILGTTQVPAYRNAQHTCPFGLTVERTLMPENLEDFGVHDATPPGVKNPMGPQPLRTLRNHVRNSSNFAAAMDHLRKFVRSQGSLAPRVLGAVHRALGGQDDSLRVDVHTPHTHAMLGLTEEMQVRYIGSAMRGRSWRQRRLFRRGLQSAQDRVKAQLQHVQEDTLLHTFAPEQQLREEVALRKAEALLEQCIPFEA